MIEHMYFKYFNGLLSYDFATGWMYGRIVGALVLTLPGKKARFAYVDIAFCHL